MTPADIIRSHKLGDAFDINGVTYRIVVLHTTGVDRDFCGGCPSGGGFKCLAGSHHACRHPDSAPRIGARFVVPVNDIPVLAMKGILV